MSAIKKFKHRFFIRQLLIGSVKLTKDADPNKYKDTGYSIGFDLRSRLFYLMEA